MFGGCGGRDIASGQFSIAVVVVVEAWCNDDGWYGGIIDPVVMTVEMMLHGDDVYVAEV